MTRLFSIAVTVLILLASTSVFADDTQPAQPTPAKAIDDPFVDPNFSTKSGENSPAARDPVAAGAANDVPAASTNSPATKPQPETAAERAARFKKLLRSEVVGDMRWLWDTQFAYPTGIAKMEADYDKCLGEERYQDGVKIAAELLAMHKAKPRHILMSVWEFEESLCRRAADKELGDGPERRQVFAIVRWNQIKELAQAEAKRPVNAPNAGDGFPGAGVGGFGSSAAGFGGGAGLAGEDGGGHAADSTTPLLYLFLRALECAARHDDNIKDEIDRGVKTVLDNVSVPISVYSDAMDYGDRLILQGKTAFHRHTMRSLLREIPADLLLYRELIHIKPENLYVISPIEAGSPFRKFQLGTHQAAGIASQKASDSESQQRIATTLKELFPTEAIEVHVVRSTAILRAALRNPVHEQQIVAIADALCDRVLNQMTVSSEPNDLATGVEKLELLGKDTNGLREVLAKLYPKEHIEVHVLSENWGVVLRGQLSRPEYAQQVFDIAETSYASVLYQMTPPLPEKKEAKQAPSVKSNTRSLFGKPPRSSPAMVDADTSDSTTIKMSDWTIIRLSVPDVEGVADVLQKQFGERASIRFGPRLDSISVKASPQVVEEVRAAASKLERPTPATGQPAQFNPLSVLMGGGSPVVATDPQEIEFDREARQLAMQFRSAKADEQQTLRKQLEQLTERHFVHRQQRRQVEIDELAQRIEKLKSAHQRRGENQAAIIQQRVRDLLDPNADLRWEELRTNEVSNPNASSRVGTAHQNDASGNPFGRSEKMVGRAHPTTTVHPPEGVANAIGDKSATVGTAPPTAASPVEPTFDGTPYSQWLKMLETERKPEKLAAAMDACSRLAVKEDVSRIVRSIIAAAEPFEADEGKDRTTVWSAGRRGLGRLLGSDIAHETDFVFAEVQSRIDNPRFVQSPGFVCQFLGSLGGPDSLVNTDAPIKSLQAHAAPIIAALLRHHATLKQFDPRLADAAAGVWMLSKAPMDDFEGLRPFVMKGFEVRIVDKGHYWPWHSLKSPEYAKQFPEVVKILTEQFDKKPDVLARDLGALGPLAEPAVPKLVARLVAVWKSREEMDRATASGRWSPYSDSDGTWHSQMGFVFDALQKIGPQAKSAVPILKEFLSICPANNDGDNVRGHRRWMASAINDTLRAIGDTANVGGPEAPPQLSDFSHLTTVWKLTSSQPGQTIEGIRMTVGRVVDFSGQQEPRTAIIGLIGCGTNPRSYVIDESTTPKQITLVDKDRKDFQQSGIYELKGDRLKIEFAKPGLARPKVFSVERDTLPEGHVLLEFDRDR